MITRKIIGGIGLVIVSSYGIADSATEQIRQELNKRIEAQGFLPAGGVVVVSPGKLQEVFPKHISKRELIISQQRDAEQQQRGYYSTDDNMAQYLLQLPDAIASKQYQFGTTDDPLDTHMKHTIQDVRVGYDFKHVPSSDVTTLLGFAASGSYDNNIGWDGIGEFFVHDGIGVCIYHDSNIQLAHSSMQIEEGTFSRDVNNKITTIDVRGSNKTGFIYEVSWFDKDFFRSLECASMKYSSSTTTLVIALANRIDSQ